MRRIREAVLCFEFDLPKGPKPVLEYCEDYVAISQVLDANPEILDAFHEDVKKLSQGGRRGTGGGLHLGEPAAGLDRAKRRGAVLAEDGGQNRHHALLAGLLAAAEEGGDGPYLFGQVPAGDPPGNPAEDQRDRGPLCDPHRGHRSDGDPRRHHRGGRRHPLSHRFLAALGRVAGGGADAGRRPRPRSDFLRPPLPHQENQGFAPVHHALQQEHVGQTPAGGEGAVSPLDRADGTDHRAGGGLRGACRAEREH